MERENCSSTIRIDDTVIKDDGLRGGEIWLELVS